MKIRKADFTRFAPPGADLRPQWRVFFLGTGLSFLYSLGFIFRCFDAWNELYVYQASTDSRVLRAGAFMPDFFQLLDGAMLGFGLLALIMLGFCMVYYAYHRQESRSIYLMRRLPNRWELHRRCLSLPLLGAAASILAAALLVVVYYGIYRLVTPAQCFRPGQWEMIWRMLS